MRRLALWGIVAATVAGCASGPAVTASPRSAVATSASLRLSLGSSFQGGAFLPQTTCDLRPDSSPALLFRSTGAGVEQLALTMVDTTDGTVYWIQTGIAAGATHVTEHVLSPGAREWLNGLDQDSYDGPCQPTGRTDTYALTLYALPTPVDLTASPGADASVATLLAASTDHVTVTATYTRTGTVPPRYAPGGPYLNGSSRHVVPR